MEAAALPAARAVDRAGLCPLLAGPRRVMLAGGLWPLLASFRPGRKANVPAKHRKHAAGKKASSPVRALAWYRQSPKLDWAARTVVFDRHPVGRRLRRSGPPTKELVRGGPLRRTGDVGGGDRYRPPSDERSVCDARRESSVVPHGPPERGPVRLARNDLRSCFSRTSQSSRSTGPPSVSIWRWA